MKLQSKFEFSIEEKAFEIVVCEMAAILSRGVWVEILMKTFRIKNIKYGDVFSIMKETSQSKMSQMIGWSLCACIPFEIWSIIETYGQTLNVLMWRMIMYYIKPK